MPGIRGTARMRNTHGDDAQNATAHTEHATLDSERDLVDGLIAQGKRFNWSNFCQNHANFPGQYAGADTPEWAGVENANGQRHRPNLLKCTAGKTARRNRRSSQDEVQPT